MSNKESYESDELKNFNDFIDVDGDITILNAEFKKSEILYELDNTAYFEAFNEYKEQEYNNRIEIIFSQFPSHIAMNFRKFQNGYNHTSAEKRLGYLIDCSESIGNLLYALVMSELRYKNIKLNDFEYRNSDDLDNPQYQKLNSKTIFTDKYAIKIRIIQSIIEKLNSEGNEINCCQIPLEVLNNLYEINQIRNDIRHSGSLSEDQYETKFQPANKLLRSIINSLSFLEECKILKLEKYEKSKLHCILFNGDSSVAKYTNVELDSDAKNYVLDLESDELFVNWNGVCFGLSPFLHYKTEYSGHESVICSYKRLSNGEFVFEHSKTKQEEKFIDLASKFSKEREVLKEIFFSDQKVLSK
ncbi:MULTISPECIES: hypothetical protein [Bacillus cereus group]|uniref:hypothetical protein n=1 Tax=Bacillus cereus group TaxID=86661 RepID=UPI000BF4A614|nr:MULTISPECIES: hypothetical protein [Bacillus cereus group]MED3620896.1 hypothetical protein [Bacillus thuringiensis]PEW28502.1 hypothetical protein CN427_11770 [Bacillus thuringiensis]PHF52274.1 hypothetical protein COI41_22285 [Bacillus toyonensis]